MTTRKPSARAAAPKTKPSEAKPVKARGTTSPTAATKPNKNKQKPASHHKPEPNWVWHGVLDVSMECRPLLRPVAPGERHMDFMVQAHHAHMPQGGPSQLTLRLRAQINVPDGPVALAEIHYSGIAEKQLSAEEVQNYHVALYPLARAAMITLMAQGGHTPPLPENIEDMKQEDIAS